MNFYWDDDSLSNIFIDGIFISGIILCFWISRIKHKNTLLSGFYLKNYSIVLLYYSACILIISRLPYVSSFLFIRYLWLIITVAFPIALSYVFFRTRKSYILFLIICVLFIKYDAEIIEPNNLDIQKINFNTGKIKSKLKIAHLSDLHYEGNLSKLKQISKEIIEFNPEYIFLTGDFLNDLNLEYELFNHLASLGKYKIVIVDGDHDSSLNFEKIAKDFGLIYLKNNSFKLESNGIPIIISGIINKLYKDQPAFNELNSTIDRRNLNILLSHRPDIVYLNKIDSFDIIFTGHTHGGQVNLPWIGPLFTVSKIPNYIAKGGLFRLNDTNIVSNRGIGMEGHVSPRIRFLCKPHLILLEINSKNE